VSKHTALAAYVRVMEILAKLEETKPLYAELDKLLLILAQSEFNHMQHGDGFMILVDNFSEKNTAFRAAGVRRFELKYVRELPRVAGAEAPTRAGTADSAEHLKPLTQHLDSFLRKPPVGK